MHHRQHRFRQLWALAPANREHYPALRMALGVAVPLLALLALGQPQLSIFAILGAFTGLYGRHEPWRERLRHQLYGAALLLSGAALGLLLGHWQVGAALTVVVAAASAALLAPLTLWLGLRPAGAVFFTLAVGTLSQIPFPAPLQGWLLTAGAALWCLGLGVLGAFYSRRVRPGELRPHAYAAHTPAELARFGLRHGLVLALAGAVSLGAGLGHLDWALVSAAAVVGVAGHRVRLQRSGQRIVGTLVGLGVAAALLLLGLPAWASVVLVIVLQFLAQLFIVRNYVLGLLFITPLALVMTHLARPTDIGLLLETRLLETLVGSLSGLVGILLLPAKSD